MISSIALVTASALGTAGLPPAWEGALRPAALHSIAPMQAAAPGGAPVGVELCRPAGALRLGQASPFRLAGGATADRGFRIGFPATAPVCSPPPPAPDRFLTELPGDQPRPRPGDPGQTVLASTAQGGGGPVAAQGGIGGGGGGSPLAGPVLTSATPATVTPPPPAAAVPLPGPLALLLGALGTLGAIAGRARRLAG